MKQLVLSLLVILSLNTLQAQSKKELKAMLQRDLAAYQKQNLKPDFDSIMMFMPPKLFDITPKDSMIAMLRSAMNNEFMAITMTGMNIIKPSSLKIKKAGAYYWTIVPYEGSMYISLKTTEELHALVGTMMKSTFGEENVKQEENGNLNVQLKDKKLVAFKDPAMPYWYMIEDKRNSKDSDSDVQQRIMETVLPEEVLKAIK